MTINVTQASVLSCQFTNLSQFNETSIVIVCSSKNFIWHTDPMITKPGHNLMSILVVTIQLPHKVL